MQEQVKVQSRRFYFTLVVLSAWTLFGVFFGTQNYLRDMYVGKMASLPGYIVGWLLCGYSWAALTVPVLRFLRVASLERLGWSRFFLIHIPAAACFSLVQLGVYVAIAGTLFGTREQGLWAFYKFIVVSELQTSILVYFAIILGSNAYRRFYRSSDTPADAPTGPVSENSHSDVFLRRLSIKENGRITLVETGDIRWIGTYGNYLLVHTAGRRHIYRDTMAAMEKKLDPAVFIRIRRSTLLNSAWIKDLRPVTSGEFEVVLKDGTTLTSSRRYRKNLESILHP